MDRLLPDTPTLLSLPEDVYRIIIRHLSRAHGGLKALLNLRETCSTTKGWVDNLPEMEASRLFSQGQVYVNMKDEEDVAAFLNTPPPRYIKSLRLILIMPDGRTNKQVSKDDGNWNMFIDFWKAENRQLEGLQISKKSLSVSADPYEPRLINFIVETAVKSVHFINNSYYRAFHKEDRVLIQLEELLLDDHYLSASDLIERLISLNVPLKKLKFPFRGPYMEEFNSVRKLIELRRQDLDFELTVLLPGLPDIDPHFFYEFAYPQGFMQLYTSIANSKSKIRIHNFNCLDVAEMVRILGLQTACEQLFPQVSSVCCFNAADDLSVFPNLTRIVTRSCTIEHIPPALDEKVQEIYVKLDELPVHMNELPRRLTSLHLQIWDGTIIATDFVRVIDSLSEACPHLQFLSLWFHHSVGIKQKAPNTQASNNDAKVNKFPNLKVLKLITHGWYVSQLDLRLFLTQGFGLAGLTSLCKLKLQTAAEPAETFDRELVRSLLDGPVGSTLFEMDFNDRVVAKNARELMKELRNRVEDNEERRRSTVGCRKGEIIF